MSAIEWFLLAAIPALLASSIYFRFVKPWRAVRGDLAKLASGDHRLPPLTSDYAPYFESAGHIRKISSLLEQLDRQVVEEGLSLRAILSGMREGILLVNRRMRTTLCNPALEGVFPEIKKFLDRTVLEIFRRHELQHAVELALRTQWPRVPFSAFPKIYLLRKFILSMLMRLIKSTALLSIKQTVQKLNNVDWTHRVLLDNAKKERS